MAVATPQRIPTFDMQFTEAVCNVLAQTNHPGLTNTEIDTLLGQINVKREPGNNKRESLYITLNNAQVRQKCGNALGGFVARAMSPARYVNDHRRWIQLRDQLNSVLVLYGFRVNDHGKLQRGVQAATLSEAAKLAGELSAELARRDVHPDLLRYCEEEVIARDLFHAMSEAAKSVPARVRMLTGLTTDGQQLYDEAFGGGKISPRLLINDYQTDSQISEHKGFKNMLVGIHGHYRNPRAHSTRLDSAEQRIDLYDLFAVLSYIHRRLDSSRS